MDTASDAPHGPPMKAVPTGVEEDGVIRAETGSDPSQPGNIIWLKADPQFAPNLNQASSGETIADPLSYEVAGRSYTAYRDNKYFLPNDAAEQDRLDLQHELFELVIDRELGLAPIARGIPSYPANVLDIASGTGLWALEFAERHPESYVIGTDLSLIQPKRELANFEFIREDSEEPWTFDRTFDYVHLRAVCSCFNDHRTVLKNAFDNMNEGGWIEYQDIAPTCRSFDGTVEGTALETLNRQMLVAFGRIGRPLVERVMGYKGLLQEAGFINVAEEVFPVPTNPWPQNAKFKKLGNFCHADVSEGFWSTTGKVLPLLGLTKDEIQKLAEDFLRDLGDPAIHAWMPFYFVYGQKPHGLKNAGVDSVGQQGRSNIEIDQGMKDVV